jgi:hypothetical protein
MDHVARIEQSGMRGCRIAKTDSPDRRRSCIALRSMQATNVGDLQKIRMKLSKA